MTEFLFPSAERALKDQLAESITYRRYRLLWNRKHSTKLGRERRTEEVSKSTNEEDTAAGVQRNLHQSLRIHYQQGEMRHSGALTESLLSSTQASHRQLDGLMKRISLPVQDHSPQGVAGSFRSANPPPRAQYPKRPQMSVGETKIPCQYCLDEVEIPLNASEGEKQTLWRFVSHNLCNGNVVHY